MPKIIAGVIVEKSHALTLDELCNAIQTQPEIVVQLIEYQLIHPEGETRQDWRFDSVCLKRARIAASFYHNLEVNMPGIALALELLDEIDHLQQELSMSSRT